MHVGVATATPEGLAVAADEADGLEADRATPEHAAAIAVHTAPNPATIIRLRVIVAASTGSSMLIVNRVSRPRLGTVCDAIARGAPRASGAC